MWGFILPSSRFFPGRHFVDTELKKIYVKFLEAHKSQPCSSLFVQGSWTGSLRFSLTKADSCIPFQLELPAWRPLMLPGIENSRLCSRTVKSLTGSGLKHICPKNNLWVLHKRGLWSWDGFSADCVRRVGSAWGAPGKGERWEAARAPRQNRNPRHPLQIFP